MLDILTLSYFWFIYIYKTKKANRQYVKVTCLSGGCQVIKHDTQ